MSLHFKESIVQPWFIYSIYKQKEKEFLKRLLTCIAIVLQLYLTDLSTRESVLVCNNEHPVLQLALEDDTIWVASTDSSIYGWPAEGQAPQKVFQKGGSFLAGNLSFSRARASLEGSAPVCGFCLLLC